MYIRLALVAVATSAMAFAQNTLVTETKGMYDGVKTNLIRSAEKMTEENYSFKPSPDVRSFGQLMGHVADANYLFCSAVKGEKNPAPGIEKGKTTKADLVEALKTSFTYCDGAYEGLTDQQAMGITKFFNRERSKLSILNFNTAHAYEHYGNAVTYLRIKGLVPPSSERRPQ